MSEIPVIELPPGGGDLQKLAEEMSDVEMKALLIQTYRAQTEILKFVRNFQVFMDTISNMGGVSGAMVQRKMPAGLMDQLRKPAS